MVAFSQIYQRYVHAEGPPLKYFSADSAAKLWWNDCNTTQRTNQAPRKKYKVTQFSQSSEQMESSDEWLKLVIYKSGMSGLAMMMRIMKYVKW